MAEGHAAAYRCATPHGHTHDTHTRAECAVPRLIQNGTRGVPFCIAVPLPPPPPPPPSGLKQGVVSTADSLDHTPMGARVPPTQKPRPGTPSVARAGTRHGCRGRSPPCFPCATLSVCTHAHLRRCACHTGVTCTQLDPSPLSQCAEQRNMFLSACGQRIHMEKFAVAGRSVGPHCHKFTR